MSDSKDRELFEEVHIPDLLKSIRTFVHRKNNQGEYKDSNVEDEFHWFQIGLEATRKEAKPDSRQIAMYALMDRIEEKYGENSDVVVDLAFEWEQIMSGYTEFENRLSNLLGEAKP